MSVTGFGASFQMDPRAAAGVLRAHAGRSVDLQPVTDVDAAAAVAGAHLWTIVTGQTSLSAAHRCAPAAVAVAAAVLARAAGSRTVPLDPVESDLTDPAPNRVLIGCGEAVAWLRGHLTAGALDAAVQAVAVDLAAGAGMVGEDAFAAVAEAFLTEADVA